MDGVGLAILDECVQGHWWCLTEISGWLDRVDGFVVGGGVARRGVLEVKQWSRGFARVISVVSLITIKIEPKLATSLHFVGGELFNAQRWCLVLSCSVDDVWRFVRGLV